MPLYNSATYTDTGTKASINLDPSIVPFNASVGVTLASTGSYKIQFSLDSATVSDANSNWFDSANFPTGTTSSVLSNINFPVAKMRIVIAANGSGITLQVRQGLSTN